jgi:hypothetical protein
MFSSSTPPCAPVSFLFPAPKFTVSIALPYSLFYTSCTIFHVFFCIIFMCVCVCVYLSCSMTSLFPPFLYAVFLRVFTCVCSSDMTWCDCSMWRVICINIVPCVNFHRMKHSLRFTPMYIFLIICDVLSLSIRCGPASVLYVCADALYDTAHHSK